MTLIALPAWWLLSRDDGSSGPDTARASTETTVVRIETPAPQTESNLPRTADIDQRDPIFMDGPTADPNAGVAEVAVPAAPAIAPIEMAASYSSEISGANKCLVVGISTGRTITVTNLDNGRTVTCESFFAPATQRDDILLHTDTFSRLADLTEAPIPVEIRQ